MIFVDDNVLDGFPPVENGKRSTKPRSPLESLSLGLCRSRRIARWDLFLALWERMHWIVESSVNIWLAETYLASKNPDKIDEKFTELWLKLKRYLHDRKQRSDLLRLAMKELGDTIVEAVNHKIDDQPVPLPDTELPAHEQQQVTRFVFAKDQKLALASRLLQRKLIHELFGVDYDTIDIARTPENKPYWKRSTESHAPPSWNYNVSHHGTVLAIASDSCALVGVDVVRLTDRPKRKTSVEEFFGAFADHFNPGEWKYIREIEDEDEQYSRFYRLWSLKEAYIKAVGIGLGFSLLRAEFARVDSTGEDHWELFLDGRRAGEWRSTRAQIDAVRLASVAYGPFSAAWKPEATSLFSNTRSLTDAQSADVAGKSEDKVEWRE
ncbi:L-aminoadipate-semialdehyde dehydrogenase-phosphopantetheinyl transferase-like [Phytophthora cinnamomi]|uniref:L-aminoadipate-semialdehyde dehydrogenase-phosphopantetheinyl transferase-like n=1 Tax=Phytophthora cinnamomi TaxID=4785 RepID=UPI0035597297|nr:L-aminoadipate-semialdehyde dehydrogenase-phosphopantetheinyl transferase-like [Phytophthora cinnamomi]